MNPAGSVKDRAAYGIITDAERAGRLKPGATIVEGTAGNTGIGLAVIGRARGYRIVIVIPNNQSPEKMNLLRTLGAEVIAVPEKPYRDPENYNHIARRLAEERGWFWANQFDNTANRDAHYVSTGPEIWKQTEGQVSAFVAAVGTGGTLAGASFYLKEQNPNVDIVCADPYGAAMWSWFTNGNLIPTTEIRLQKVSVRAVSQRILKASRSIELIVFGPEWVNDRLPASARRRSVPRTYQAGSTSPVQCASRRNLAEVRRSSRFSVTRVTNINQRFSIATGWHLIISFRTFLWNRFSNGKLSFKAIPIFVARDGVVAELRRDADGEFSEKLFRIRGNGSFSCLPDYTNITSRERA